ncbi:hypothetical protein COB55_01710 [Candidatus Wolfebacteria bacterium]|nr:MAG: hypothetical protein COB55_01710 [Candidatus Wolfebacteria bacterium]
MIITYHGVEAVKVQFGDTTLGFNPVSKKSKAKGTRFGADIALQTLNHPDTNGVDSLQYGDKEVFSITGPGEYEVGGVFIKGFPSKSNYGAKELINTIYTVALEGMNICFLGALSSTELDPKVRESLDSIDVLFVPIGGEGVLTADEAYKFSISLGPKIIIPIHYGDVGDKDALKNFLKEGGAEKNGAVEKLTLKKKDLADKEGEIIVLNTV